MANESIIKSVLDLILIGNRDAVVEAIKRGITTPKILASTIEGSELVDDCLLVIRADSWRADDGTAEVEITATSARVAAEQYVSDGVWDRNETSWIDVTCWREGIDGFGDTIKVDKTTITVTIEADPPECTDTDHDWKSPWNILGGCKDNPGVWGHGGGVIIHEVCMNCGCERITDTWAQNPTNGVDGLRKVSYKPDEYADEVEELKEQS